MWSNNGQFTTLQPPNKQKNRVKRRESLLSRGFSALVRRESMFNLSPPKAKEAPQMSSNGGRKIGRAMSFKYPEKISHIPPPEITRIRSKSQVREIRDSEDEEDERFNAPRPPPFLYRPPSPPSRPAPPLMMMMQQRMLPARPPEQISRRRHPIPDSFFYGDDKSDDEYYEDELSPPPRGRPIVRRHADSSYYTTGSSTHDESFFDETLVPVTMVSRRKILSRSRDDLNLDEAYHLEEEDVWYQKEKLYRDHVEEVLGKWDSIDDEIWAKVIVLERNRRVAKAYARAPVLTVNDSEDGFDGFRIGVNGFENPMRDPKTEEFKAQIGTGCKIKMDETGNIMVKRFSKSAVFVKNMIEENAVSNDVLKLPHGQLEFEKPVKLFDMKKFQQNVNRELKRSVPDRKKLECQCIAAIAFVKNEPELLDSPIWVMLINVVALEMLRAKMPSGPRASLNEAAQSSSGVSQMNKSSDPRKRFPASGSSDEDPYSLTPSGSSGSSGKGNRSREELPRLPSGEKEYFGPQNWAKHHIRQIPDYSDEMEDENTLTKKRNPRLKNARNKSADSERMGRKSIEQYNGDDPYYCGLRARVPNYVQQNIKKECGGNSNVKAKANIINNKLSVRSPAPSRSAPNLQNLAQLPGAHPLWWHSRLYPDTELSSYHYPGRISNRGYRNSMPPPITTLAPPPNYRGNWD